MPDEKTPPSPPGDAGQTPENVEDVLKSLGLGEGAAPEGGEADLSAILAQLGGAAAPETEKEKKEKKPPAKKKAAKEAPASPAAGQPIALPSLEGAAVPQGPDAKLDLLHDVDLNVRVELGRTRLTIQDILRLTSGSVVTLDKMAGDPVDIYVNNRLVARGEVMVQHENFVIRVTEIVAQVQGSTGR